MPEPCKFEDKIIELSETLAETANNVAWLKKNAETLNGKFMTHINESDKFRSQVTRNTIWRWIYKGGFITTFGLLAWLFCKLYELVCK